MHLQPLIQHPIIASIESKLVAISFGQLLLALLLHPAHV